MQFSKDPVTDTTLKLLLMTLIMGASVFFVMIPLYNVLCDALGINGKTSSVAYIATKAASDMSREIEVQFITQNNENMPWDFNPSSTVMRVNPGALNDTHFIAENVTDGYMIGQAVPSVSPSRAAEYFHKTECFCFESQSLNANSSVEMPLRFIIDQDLPRDIKTVTLSYTLFDITNNGGSQ